MKHRSIHIFILIAAALVAAPQASQEFSALRDAVGRRVRTEIFSAFLGFQAGEAARPAAAQQAPESLLASGCESAPAEARRARQTQPPATHVEVHARREVPADVVMLVEPSEDELAQLDPEPPAADAVAAPAYHFELYDEKAIRGAKLAMLTSPDEDAAPARPAAREAVARVRGAAQKRRADEVRQQRASFAAHFEEAERLRKLSEIDLPEVLRQLDLDLDLYVSPGWTKAPKAKRAPRPAPAPARPAARQQCPSRRTAQLACGPSTPELLLVSE